MSKRRPNGDGMVRKRPDGRWEARIIVGHKEDGKPIYKSVFGKTQSEAMTKFYKLLETYRGVELNEDCLVNLNEWLDRWLCYQKDVVRPQTLNKYVFYADAYVRPYLGDKKISAILTRDMQQLYVKLLKEGRVTESKAKGKSLSGSTVRAVHMMMHKCFEMAVEQHIIVKNLTAGNLDRTGSYIIKESTVVADQHHRLGTLRQELLQPLDTLDIKMVGRLIEEEHIRLLEQDFCQLDTHTPSAGELSGRTVEIFTGETQTAQCALYFCLVVFTAHHHIAIMFLGELLHELGIALALVVGAVGHFLLHLVEARLHLGIVGESLSGFLLYGGIILQFHHLRQIADGGFIRDSHYAGSWLLQST